MTSPLFSVDGIRTLTVRSVKDAIDDRITGLAAEVTFFMILSGPPLLLAILGAVGYVAEAIGPKATGEIRSEILSVASTVLTPDATRTAGKLVDIFLTQGRADIVSIGAIAALWSASRATNGFMQAVAIAYDVPERTAGWRKRLLSLAITVVIIIGSIILLPLVVAGPKIGRALGEPLHVGDLFGRIWSLAYWPGVFLIGVAFVALLYHLAPGRMTPWHRDLPGAGVAAALWIIGGAALRIYAGFSLSTGGVYGPLAAPMAILLWVYISAIALLMGAEVNAEMEKLWPHAGVQAPPAT